MNEAFEFVVASDEEGASQRAASIIADQIKRKPDSLICTASGATPTRTYALLAGLVSKNRFSTGRMSVVKLDEWLELPLDDPHTCESFQRTQVLSPLDIPADRYIGFDSQPPDEQAECQRVEDEITRAGGIDLAILGIGVNGHIGLNEPAEYLQLRCHVAELAPTTVGHSMLEGADQVARGITLGMRDILNARHILLLAFGDHKAEPIRHLMDRRVSTQFPASFLWLHAGVTCICDPAAARHVSEAD